MTTRAATVCAFITLIASISFVGVAWGQWNPAPPDFPSQESLCAAFHGFPIPPNLIPNVANWPQGEEAYVAQLAEFIRDRDYALLGWLHDREWRLTGPYFGCPCMAIA